MGKHFDWPRPLSYQYTPLLRFGDVEPNLFNFLLPLFFQLFPGGFFDPLGLVVVGVLVVLVVVGVPVVLVVVGVLVVLLPFGLA